LGLGNAPALKLITTMKKDARRERRKLFFIYFIIYRRYDVL